MVSTEKKEMTTGYVRGEVTVYLTLTFILLVSFVLALTESVSIQMAKNYRRADMNRAVECVFAEYQKELLEHYDVFAIEAGYESGTYSEQNLLDRLSYYGADMENDIKRIRLFTDQNGELFMDQAGKYMKHKYGISWADKYLGSTSIWKNQERQADEITREEKAQTDRLEELLNGQDVGTCSRTEAGTDFESGITERNTGIRKTDCVRGHAGEPRESDRSRNI